MKKINVLLLLLALPGMHAVSAERARPAPAAPREPLTLLKIAGNVHMIGGAGANIIVQAGPDGMLVVDAGDGSRSAEVLELISKLSDRPLRYLINTHAHRDNTGGNADIAKSGKTLAGANIVGLLGEAASATAKIVAHENVPLRMMEAPDAASIDPAGVPVDLYISPSKDIYFNDEVVQVLREPEAHTDGDSFVYFRASNVVSTGDIYTTESYPVIDKALGGSIQGVIAGLNRLLDIMVPKAMSQGGTMVVPSRGRISDELDVVEFRDMVVIIAERIQNMVNQGMSLDEVIAARPTLDYEPRYGTDQGAWTTRQFVETIYQDLKANPIQLAGVSE